MNAMTDREKLLQAMERYAEISGIKLSTLSAKTGQNWTFYARIKAGRRYFPETGEQVLQWMRDNPPKPRTASAPVAETASS